MPSHRVERSSSTTTGRRRRTGFRADIEGLRAVAIGAVLLAHAGLPFAAGGYVGVDVFFVISGFLITGLLTAELDRTGRISLVAFYARRVKRLLPLAVTVLAVVALLAALVLSPVRADDVGRDVAAAGVYAINWKFAAESIDYFADGPAESPLQHFWSLAVEEQFYLLWPALLLAVTVLARAHRRRVLWVVLGAVAVGSFAYAVQLAAVSPDEAYFSTPARVWEPALGGLLALALAGRRLPAAAAAVAAWAGAAALAAATLLLEPGAAFPGWPALLPTLGAAALIAGGTSAAVSRPVRALGAAPMQWLGRRSYALYLWHWPLLVFAAAAWGPLSVAEGVAVTVAAFVPAALSHRGIEEPRGRARLAARRARAARAAAPAGAAAAVGFALALAFALPSTPTLAEADADGATALERSTSLQRRARALRPTPRDADKDRSSADGDGCLVARREEDSPACEYGDRGSPTTIVLFGDSHAMQYFPAFERIARRHGWRLLVLTKAGCPSASTPVYSRILRRPFAECETWRERMLQRIEREQPALGVAAGAIGYVALVGDRRIYGRAARDALTAGYPATLRRLRRAADRVALLREPPRPPKDIVECVAASLDRLRRCAFTRRQGLDRPSVDRRAARRVRGVRLIDATSRFCPHRLCPAVIGDVLVYRDGSHLTATYVKTMTAWLDRRLPKLPPRER